MHSIRAADATFIAFQIVFFMPVGVSALLNMLDYSQNPQLMVAHVMERNLVCGLGCACLHEKSFYGFSPRVHGYETL
jgi:hypothetical protein